MALGCRRLKREANLINRVFAIVHDLLTNMAAP